MVFLLEAIPLLGGFPGDHTWDWISSIPHMNGSQFQEVAYPLVQLSANAYRFPAPKSVHGWHISVQIPPIGPASGGVHALLYEESVDNPRLILAFRGTQLSSSLDSLADSCADKLLWEDFQLDSLPVECSTFDQASLDYFSQALNYTQQVLEAYPAQSLLLTGHSLGVGLAILVSVALSEAYTLPVIGFSAPATYKAMLERSLPIQGLENDNIVVIAHEWDQIMRSQWEGQVGLLCLYPKEQSSVCKACFAVDSDRDSMTCHSRAIQELTGSMISSMKDLASGQPRLQQVTLPDGGDCLACFLETHYLKNLIGLVKEGEKPICQRATGDSRQE